MSLFEQVDFIGAAGKPLTWRIECDALTAHDWRAIVDICALKLPRFGSVIAIPRGGLKLQPWLHPYVSPKMGPPLIVDDVWTTGYSMRKAAEPYGDDWIGFVAFARSKTPWNVHAFMRSDA